MARIPTNDTKPIKVPSIARIISVDYLASSAALVPVVAWGFYTCVLSLAPENAGAWRYPAAPLALTLLGLIAVVWRVRLIRAVYAAGVEVPATVQSVAHTRSQRVRVNFQYSYAGKAYAGGQTVSEGRVPVTLTATDTVTVVLDPSRPHVAFVRDSFG
jgi:hypothetical protein